MGVYPDFKAKSKFGLVCVERTMVLCKFTNKFLTGYPFTEEKQVEDALEHLLLHKTKNPAAAGSQTDEISDGDTIILVSHVGPHNSGMVRTVLRTHLKAPVLDNLTPFLDTTIDQVSIDEEPIQSGSHALRKTLLDPLIV